MRVREGGGQREEAQSVSNAIQCRGDLIRPWPMPQEREEEEVQERGLEGKEGEEGERGEGQAFIRTGAIISSERVLCRRYILPCFVTRLVRVLRSWVELLRTENEGGRRGRGGGREIGGKIRWINRNEGMTD